MKKSLSPEELAASLRHFQAQANQDLTDLFLRLKSRRKELGLSQHELSELLGMEARYCGIAERGERAPSIKMLFTWLRALRISVQLEDGPPEDSELAELSALRQEVRELANTTSDVRFLSAVVAAMRKFGVGAGE